MNNPHGKDHGLDRQIWSFDGGDTWVNDVIISYPPQHNVGGLVGPSVGIQNDRHTQRPKLLNFVIAIAEDLKTTPLGPSKCMPATLDALWRVDAYNQPL